MDLDEALVKKYLEQRETRVERFSKTETRSKKTPDFRVFAADEFAFYCEVKSSPPDGWLDKQLDRKAWVSGLHS